MPESISFQAYRPNHMQELEQMVMALYADDPGGEVMSRQKVQRTVDELTRHPEKGRIIMFTTETVVAGYAIISYYWSNEYGGSIALIDELYVKPAWRSQGIGASFLQHLHAEEGAVVKGFLLEVIPENARAFAFYTRQGFKPAKNRHPFLKRS